MALKAALPPIVGIKIAGITRSSKGSVGDISNQVDFYNVLGQKVSEDRREDRYDRRYDSRGYRYNDYRYNDRYRKDNGLHLGHYKNGKRR